VIVRTWRGRARPEQADAYAEHFRRNVVPALRRLDGFLGATLLREERAGAVEFLALTRWASMAAVRAFAGADPHRAVVEPEAAAALADYDETVQHYIVVEEAPPADG
jgi:heme-degrading monooxygenase HmoA